ncbi:MAG: hypothetical protein WA419_02510 [Silvibacterium sp.]
MPEPNQNSPATVPEQPEAKPPLRKSMPVVIALVVIIGLIGIANLSSLLKGNRKTAPASTMPMRPAAPNAQEVNSFESQQELQAKRDAEERQHQQELAAAMQQLEAAQGVPGPEASGAPPMTAAQRSAIYGDSPNAPANTSEISQERAEAKQKELAKEKLQQDAIDSDTVAIDFEHTSPAAPATVTAEAPQGATASAAGTASANSRTVQSASLLSTKPDSKTGPLAPYSFDDYQGRLYRVFEGTVLEGVVTNHIDGGFSGPIMVDLTTDLYSHDHQQLLLPQGTRLIGDVLECRQRAAAQDVRHLPPRHLP